ncbi:MAG: hypothetical protein WC942_11185 [Clostridia bacterium]
MRHRRKSGIICEKCNSDRWKCLKKHSEYICRNCGHINKAEKASPF